MWIGSCAFTLLQWRWLHLYPCSIMLVSKTTIAQVYILLLCMLPGNGTDDLDILSAPYPMSLDIGTTPAIGLKLYWLVSLSLSLSLSLSFSGLLCQGQRGDSGERGQEVFHLSFCLYLFVQVLDLVQLLSKLQAILPFHGLTPVIYSNVQL